jgi:hypothetical protein
MGTQRRDAWIVANSNCEHGASWRLRIALQHDEVLVRVQNQYCELSGVFHIQASNATMKVVLNCLVARAGRPLYANASSLGAYPTGDGQFVLVDR